MFLLFFPEASFWWLLSNTMISVNLKCCLCFWESNITWNVNKVYEEIIVLFLLESQKRGETSVRILFSSLIALQKVKLRQSTHCTMHIYYYIVRFKSLRRILQLVIQHLGYMYSFTYSFQMNRSSLKYSRNQSKSLFFQKLIFI